MKMIVLAVTILATTSTSFAQGYNYQYGQQGTVYVTSPPVVVVVPPSQLSATFYSRYNQYADPANYGGCGGC